MAVNISLTDLANLQNEDTAVSAINNNNAAIEAITSDVLSRSGVSPNSMQSNLDMNSNQIYNLPAPGSVNSPARLIDVTSNPTIQVPPTGTSGHNVPYLDDNNTWSGTNAYTASVSGVNATYSNTLQGASVVATGTLFGAALNISGSVSLPNNSVGSTVIFPGATNTVLGTVTGSSVVSLTPTQLTTIPNTFTSSLKGLVPASGGGTANYLRADGTWTNNTARTLLNTLTASNSANLQDLTSLTSAFTDYELVLDNIVLTSSQRLLMQVHTGGAFATTGYICSTFSTGGSTTIVTDASTTYIAISGFTTGTVTAGFGYSGTLRIHGPVNGTSSPKSISGTTMLVSGGGACVSVVGGCYNNAAAIDGIQFISTSGNLTSGTIKIYGLN